jgi:ATP-binding protein involved in chromosome partitioning
VSQNLEDKIKSIIKNRAKLIDCLEQDEAITVLVEINNPNLIKALELELTNFLNKKVILHTTQAKSEKKKKTLAGIDKIILVASGKGGVGKSTVSLILALFLKRAGFKVGLCDLDLHGPSLPKICGLSGTLTIAEDLFQPEEVEGIKIISMGLLIEGDAALVWRGPMLTKALHQFLLKSNWGELDYLILDSPPGTGDLQLSLLENYDITGTVLVSTPQEVALLATHRSLDLMRKLQVPTIGIIGNQAYLEAEGVKNYLFGHNTLEAYAEREKIPLLGLIPIIPALSASFDRGEPAAWLKTSQDYLPLLEKIVDKINTFI